MAAADFEPGILAKVAQALTRWLGLARRAVMRQPSSPDPSGVYEVAQAWADEVDALIPELEIVSAAGWENTVEFDFIDTDSFVQAQLQLTKNLLVRIPDEVYRLIFRQLELGHMAGESVGQIADRVDTVLLFTGSEYWENRAQVIAVTETHRAWQSGVLAAAQYYEPPGGRGWTKTWVAELDDGTRPAHRRADGQVRRLRDTFTVGGESLMYPGDPAGMASTVINCRCDMIIEEG